MHGSSNASHVPLVALGAAAATTLAAAGALYACSTSKGGPSSYQLIVFLDSETKGCSRNGTLITLPKDQVQQQLEAAVCTTLQISTVTLFLWDTKEQLLPATMSRQLDQHLVNSSSYSSCRVMLLIASESGSLSKDAARTSPVSPPPAGPRPLPFVRNALLARGPYDMPMYNFWHHLFTPDQVEKWGETVTYELPSNPAEKQKLKGHYDDYEAAISATIQTCDPDVLQELLDRQNDFPKMWNRAAERALTQLGGNGIFTSSTPSTDWQTVHGLFRRGFNQLKIQHAYFPILVRKAASFVGEWSSFAPGHLVTGVNKWLASMTADAVIKATCNLDMDNIGRMARGEAAHPVLETYRRIGSISPAIAKPWEVVGWANYLNPLYNTQAGQQAAFTALKMQLAGLVEELVEQTRRGDLGDTLLASLINDRSPTNGLYVRQSLLFPHFVNLLVAGHETTANTMGFLMYYLSQNPEWEEKIRQEVRSVLGGRSELAAADIPSLVVAEACFRETLRLHPPANQVGRDAAHDTIIKGQYLVRRGQRVQVNLVALHRQQRQWGGRYGDPNGFNPSRFMPGAAEASSRHPHAFKPFGFGVRACAGMQFALWEAKTLIPMLYHRYTFKLVQNFTLRPSRKESFPSPSAEGLAFHIYPAPGAPAMPVSPAAGAGEALLPLNAPLHTSNGPTHEHPVDAAGAAGRSASRSSSSSRSVHGTPLLVAYGSNSGTCEAFAGQLVEGAAAAGFAAAATTLDSLCAGGGGVQLPGRGALLIVSSTYNGLPPDNAVRFSKWLQSTATPGAAEGLIYGVLGVGNSQWPSYQAFPRLLDQGLRAAGGLRLSPLVEADTETPAFADAAGDWWRHLQPLLLQHFKVDAPEGAAVPGTSTAPRMLLTPAAAGTKAMSMREVFDALRAAAAAGAAGTVHDQQQQQLHRQAFGYDLLIITSAEELQSPRSGRSTRHVQLEVPHHISYSPGDHLEVLPRNAPALVHSALQLLGLSGQEVFLWTPGPQGAARGFGSLQADPDVQQQLKEPLQLPLASEDVLAWLVDLSVLPPMRTVAAFAAACPCPPEAARLIAMASEEGYKEKVLGPQLTLLELLASHRSLLSVGGLDLPGLAALLPRLAPRYYSISSSPAAAGGPRRATITVRLVEYTTPSGRVHKGAATSTIHNQKVGLNLVGTVRQLQSQFRLPSDPSIPIIMVGPGTGVAPMVGFLEEREAQQLAGAALGPSVLFFGCRSSTDDFLYKSRLESWASAGILSDLQVAFSREPGRPRVYVQDLISARGQQLWELLQQGAYVFVCGDARCMAPGVRAAFEGVATKVGGLTEGAAGAWMSSLREQGRYLEDVWAS